MPVIGQVPISPAVTAPIPVGAISVSSLAALTLAQQETIVRGTIVVTPTQSYVYIGTGDKTNPASYIDLIGAGNTTDSELAAHEADTTNVHGIANTSQLATLSNLTSYATTTALSNHESDTTSIHGIADTSALATNTGVSDSIEAHRTDATDVHGIYDTAYLTYKEEVSGIFHRNLFGWPANKLSSPRGTEQSFLSYGSSPVLFDGTEGWGTSDRPIYYVPIFIKNTAQVGFSIRVPVKNYSGTISAALFAGDNFNGTTQPSSNGHMTLVLNMGSISVAPEDVSCVFTPASSSVRRGWHFVALYFSADPTGKIYRSVYSPSGPTYGEYVFESQRRTFIEDTTEKQRRIGSVIRRVNGVPSWPPATTSAPNLFNYVENPVTPKLLYQWNGPDGSVAVSNPFSARASFFDPCHDFVSDPNIVRYNDGSYPPTPDLLSTNSPSPQGGYNLLASAVPGVLNLSTSTRFQQNMQTISHKVTEIRFYTRSTSSGPANVRTRLWSGAATPSTLYIDTDSAVSTTSTWQQIILTGTATPLQASTSLHIYGYNGSSAASAGNWRLDNIEMRGTFSSPISPANWVGMDPSIHLFAFSEVVPLFYWGYNTVVTGGSI
jgi:hypothetical protein